MVHYIRFLRTPQVNIPAKKTIDVSGVIAVTTDLGDAFYSGETDLEVRVVEAHNPYGVLCNKTVRWQADSRAVKFNVTCNGKYAARPVKVHVTTVESQVAQTSGLIPEILDVWSVVFHLADKQRAEPVVDREFLLFNQTRLRVYEETGDSIARHIWDASLGFLIYFRQLLDAKAKSKPSMVGGLLLNKPTRRLQILELGSGCGIVGIALSQLIKCDMLLTDLEDAAEILEQNIGLASPAPGSSLRTTVLDWSSDSHDSLNTKFDLVLVSDCIYNPDSSVHLVETLKRISTGSPDVLILVGFKRRHEADTIFFDHMKKANFRTAESYNMALPHHLTEYDIAPPSIEFFAYEAR